MPILVLLATGCTYRSLYFQPTGTVDQHFDEYRVRPRVFSHRESEEKLEALASRGFSVSVRIEDTTAQPLDEAWPAQPRVVDSMANAFLEQVSSRLQVDSLVLHPTPEDSERILLIHDGKSFTPRREAYFTLQFGNIGIPEAASSLRMVLHVSRLIGSGTPTADSAVWSLDRIEHEGKGVQLGRTNIHGY